MKTIKLIALIALAAALGSCGKNKEKINPDLAPKDRSYIIHGDKIYVSPVITAIYVPSITYTNPAVTYPPYISLMIVSSTGFDPKTGKFIVSSDRCIVRLEVFPPSGYQAGDRTLYFNGTVAGRNTQIGRRSGGAERGNPHIKYDSTDDLPITLATGWKTGTQDGKPTITVEGWTEVPDDDEYSEYDTKEVRYKIFLLDPDNIRTSWL